MLRIESCFHDWCNLWQIQSIEQFPAVPGCFPHRVEIRKCWERQFQSRHAPLPRVRNEEKANAADGFDARPWEQNQNARLRSRGLNTVIHPKIFRNPSASSTPFTATWG